MDREVVVHMHNGILLGHKKVDAFELWCWKRLLRVPWTARRPNQSILKEISPGYSLEGMMLKLKLQYFGHLILVDLGQVIYFPHPPWTYWETGATAVCVRV